jgi:hypothetical protein
VRYITGLYPPTETSGEPELEAVKIAPFPLPWLPVFPSPYWIACGRTVMAMSDATPLRDYYRFGGEDDSTSEEGTEPTQE